MEGQTYVVASPTIQQPHKGMSIWEWVIILIVVAAIVGVVIWMIWYFGIRKTGLPAGSNCSDNTDCETGTYCGADGQCHNGNGSGQGGNCSINDDCLVGLSCNNLTHTCQPNSTQITF